MELHEFEKMYSLEDTNWWYVSRRALLLSLLKKIVSNKRAAKVLDVGCGTGKNLMELSVFFPVTLGIDSSAEAISFCRRRGAHVKEMALEELRSDSEYDVILLIDVLEHLKDDVFAIRLINRALVKGGILYLTVPAFKLLYGPSDILNSHYRRYSLGDMRSILSKNGFSILYFSYWNFFLFLPSLFIKVLNSTVMPKLFKIKRTDLFAMPRPVNFILKKIIALENYLILKGARLPFGTSIVCVTVKR